MEEENKETSSPIQKVNGPLATIVGTGGSGFTVTIVGKETADGQLETLDVTVYVPAKETTIEGVVSPVDHVFDSPEEVSVTEFPIQISVDPLDVIIGVGGTADEVTLIGKLVDVHPLPPVRVTV